MKTCKYLLPALMLSLSLAAGAKQQPRSQLQRMVDQLNLAADQKAKVDPILEEGAKQLRALRGDTSPGAKKRKAEIRKATDSKIKPLLTQEQWKKLEQLREARKKEGRGKR